MYGIFILAVFLLLALACTYSCTNCCGETVTSSTQPSSTKSSPSRHRTVIDGIACDPALIGTDGQKTSIEEMKKELQTLDALVKYDLLGIY